MPTPGTIKFSKMITTRFIFSKILFSKFPQHTFYNLWAFYFKIFTYYLIWFFPVQLVINKLRNSYYILNRLEFYWYFLAQFEEA